MKFMNMKRFGATVMAGALALSMAAPAFAAEKTNDTTTFTGKYEPITLAVTVPKTGDAIINPYGLPVALDEETVISGEQITTGAPLLIKNQSKVALAVTAKVKGTVKGTFTFSADAVGADETANKGNVIFEAFPAPGVLDDTDTLELNAMFAALNSDDVALTATVDTAEAETTGALVLREGDEEGLTQDGGAAFVRLSGTVAKAPTTAWVAADGFEATVVFSFEPSAYVMPYDTAPTATGTLQEVNDVANLTLALPKGVKVDTTVAPVWNTDKTTNLTMADASTATELKGTATLKKAATTKDIEAKVWVEFKGTDGLTYKSAEAAVTIAKP